MSNFTKNILKIYLRILKVCEEIWSSLTSKSKPWCEQGRCVGGWRAVQRPGPRTGLMNMMKNRANWGEQAYWSPSLKDVDFVATKSCWKGSEWEYVLLLLASVLLHERDEIRWELDDFQAEIEGNGERAEKLPQAAQFTSGLACGRLSCDGWVN